MYYSCDVGGSLLKTACERGPWSRLLRDVIIFFIFAEDFKGYFAYQEKKTKLALIYYMEAAFLGYDIANLNGALLIDKYRVFSDEDLDIQKLKKDIVNDPIYIALSETKNFKPTEDINEILHDDILEVLSSLKYSKSKKDEILNKLTQSFTEVGHKYNVFVMIQLLKMGSQLQEPLSTLKLGDLYQDGKLVEQNYTLAYEYYSALDKVSVLQNHPTIISYAFYNMAYMNHHGLGRAKNLTKAIFLYNLSLTMKKTNYYLVTLNMKLAEIEKAYFEQYLNTTTDAQNKTELTLNDIIKHNITSFEERYAKKIFLGFLLLAAAVLFLLRLRLKNYIGIYLKDHSHRD